MQKDSSTADRSHTVTITLGHEQLVIRRRYEAASILNDFLIAAWFLVGSIFFLYPSLKEAGVWLFIIGSAQFMMRPLVRLAQHLHLQRTPASSWEM